MPDLERDPAVAPATWAWRSPGVAGLRTTVTLVGLLSLVLVPGEHDLLLTALGLGLVLVAAAELWQVRGLEPAGRVAGVIRGMAPAAGAAVVLLAPGDAAVLALAAGAVLAVRAVADACAATTVGRATGLRTWLLCLALLEAGGAVAGLLLTDLFGQAVLVTLAFAWLSGGVVAGVRPVARAHRRWLLAPVASSGRMSAEAREALADSVHYDGPEARQRVERFLMLITIATVIATYGVLQGSVAAVIGAMIVAPLMGPIQALAVGLVGGANGRALRAGLLILGGMAAVLVVSMLIAATTRDLPTLLSGEQVLARTAPGLPDLAVALAAGAAGGLALVRRDVTDSLPGVAIAVSLVPPLCVSGATLAGGQGTQSVGAFLLFAVNMVAIVVATGVVLVFSGFGHLEGGRRYVSLSVACGAALAGLAVPLATTGFDTVEQESLDAEVRLALDEWLAPLDGASVHEVRIDGDRVSVVVISVDRPPSAELLEADVSDEVGRTISVDVEWLAVRRVD